MIYNGNFRNTDTSIDPKGQLYKVLIDTDIRDKGSYAWLPSRLSGNISVPQTPIKIQLADDPFVVEYEGDTNIYKPYKCSTATVRIMLDKLQRDFICTKKNDIFVALLKWKNEVHTSLSQDLKPIMVNDQTGEILNQQSISNGSQIIWTGFDPRVYDAFCYEVEWVGYTTPNTFSQEYTKLYEPFELECQDALSTLQYFDYKVEQNQARTFYDTIIQCLMQIDSVYKHIYVTKSIVIEPADIRNTLEKLTCLDGNWFDEDNEPEDCLEVIKQLMQYVNCTIVAYQDSLFITNYDAIASEQRIYKAYNRDDLKDVIIDQSAYPSWIPSGLVYLGSNFNIDGLKLAGSDTQISTSSTYKKVELKTDEYYHDSLIPNIEDDDQVEKLDEFDGAELVYENTKHISGIKYDKVTRTAKDAGILLRVKNDAGYGKVETTTYKRDTVADNTGSSGKHIVISNTIIDNPVLWTSYHATNCCVPVEYGSLLLPEVSGQYLSELFRGYDGSRAFLFHTPAVTWGQLNPPPTGEAPDLDRYWDISLYNGNLYFGSSNDFQPQIQLPMLKITSKPTFFKYCNPTNKTGQFLQITGDWTFYNSLPHSVPVKGGWNTTINENLLAEAHHMYSWVKICAINSVTGQKMWVKSINSNEGTHYEYQWTSTEQWCKLFYGGRGYNNVKYQKKRKGLGATVYTLCAESDAFETDFSIIKNNFGVDGTIIPMPQQMGDFYGTVSIEFNRPVGCGYENDVPGSQVYFASCSVLSNFNMNIVDYADTEYFGGEELSDSDGKYEVKMNDYAVDDFSSINSKLSSGFRKSTNLSNVYVNTHNNNKRITSLTNDGCGISSLPEKIIVNAIAGTYKEPRLLLDISLHKHFINNCIIDTYKWNTQFEGIQFVANSLILDYENDTVKVSLFEKPSLLPEKTTFTNITRNRRRNGDNLFNDLPRKDKSVINDDMQPTLSNNMGINRVSSDKQNEGFRDLQVSDGRIAPGNLNVTAGLLKKSRVEVNFDNGFAQLSYPDGLSIKSLTDNQGNLIIEY